MFYMLYMCVFIQIFDIQVNHMITNSNAFIGNINSCEISYLENCNRKTGWACFSFFLDRLFRSVRSCERTVECPRNATPGP